MNETLESPLISARALRRLLGDASMLVTEDVRVVDVRFTLNQPGRGRAAYDEGHIPGAIHLDIDTDLSDLPRGGPGRHPLPALDAVRARLAAAGIGDRTRVVAYDEDNGMSASRLWWVLAWLGHEHTSVLDGGLAAWLAEGGRLTNVEPGPAPRALSRRAPLARAISRDDVVSAIERGALLLDARAPERYEGKVEPIDKRPGHIPTAKNAPFAANLDASKQFLAPASLREKYEALGATAERSARGDVVTYCGSGVTACHDALAMVVAGLPMPLLYEGSWSDWIHDAKMPESLGSDPGTWTKPS